MCAVMMLCCPNVCCGLYVCSAPSHGCQAEATQSPECALAEGKEGGGYLRCCDAVFVLVCTTSCILAEHRAPTTGVSAMSHPVSWVRLG
jgi:hypothetical protein